MAEDIDRSAEKWLAELRIGHQAQKDWIERGKRIVRRYRDERNVAEDNTARFNILWSNIETLFPAIYSRPPKAEVARRNKDTNPVARTAARILERALQFEIDQYPDFDAGMRYAVLDRLLPGRGVVWIRFEQYEIDRPSDDDEAQPELAEPVPGMPPIPGMEGMLLPPPEPPTPEVKEHACVDYVYWEDFRHGQARIWADVPWIARREYLTREEGVERFGDKFRTVPLVYEPVGLDEESHRTGTADELKKAAVWEIWDKRDKSVKWVSEGFPGILDEKDDIYGLEGFYPVPTPLYATLTSDQLIPVPDFSLYQDQAQSLDLLATRIKGLTEALKLVGGYDDNQEKLADILTSPDNTLVPISGWTAFSEKGGLAGAMEFVPIKDVAAALQACYASVEQQKQQIYEITGISDIIRGATKASETATAQDIKRQFGSLRLQNRQREVAMFATEILRIKAQLMMDIYSPETLVAMSGIMDTEDAQYVDAALGMLQTEPLREYQINVAADSLVAIDEEQEKAQRMEFLQAVGGYIRQAMQAVEQVPEMAPLAMELMMFVVRAFPAAKSIEGSFEEFQASIQQRMQQPPQDGAAQVEQQRLQAEQQQAQAKLQADMQVQQVKLQADMRAEQIKAESHMQIERERMQMQAQLEQQRAQMQAQVDQARAEADARARVEAENAKLTFERWRAELEAATKIQIEQMRAAAQGVLQINEATQAATDEIAREVKP